MGSQKHQQLKQGHSSEGCNKRLAGGLPHRAGLPHHPPWAALQAGGPLFLFCCAHLTGSHQTLRSDITQSS